MLIAIMAFAWVSAGERLSLFLDRFKTVRLASLPTQPLSAYNGKEGTYYAGALFIGKEEMLTSKMSDWMPFPLSIDGVGNQLYLFTGGKSFRFGPNWQPPVTMSDVWSLHSHLNRMTRFPLLSKRA